MMEKTGVIRVESRESREVVKSYRDLQGLHDALRNKITRLESHDSGHETV